MWARFSLDMLLVLAVRAGLQPRLQVRNRAAA